MSILDLPQQQSNRQQYDYRIDKAIAYIYAHLAEPLDLEHMARAAEFSPYHFHRIFTALCGENPQDFVNRLRLERAANLLVKSPALAITEVAYASGFSSPSAFARSFKKYFGIPAREYVRESRRQSWRCRPPAWVATRPRPGRQPPDEPAAPRLMDIHMQTMPSVRLAYFSARSGYSPETIRRVWQRLLHWAGAHGLPAGAGRLVAISFDDPEITPPAKCRYDACLIVPDDFAVAAPASLFEYPAQLCAVLRLNCDAEEIQPVYRLLYRDWLPGSGYLLADLPPFEIYYNAPDADPNSKYVFDMCIPVEL